MTERFSRNLPAKHADTGGKKGSLCSRGRQKASQPADFLGRDGTVGIHEGKIVQPRIFIPGGEYGASFADIVGEEDRFQEVEIFFSKRFNISRGFRLLLGARAVIHDLDSGRGKAFGQSLGEVG